MEEYGNVKTDQPLFTAQNYNERENPYTQIQNPEIPRKEHLMGRDFCSSIFDDQEQPIAVNEYTLRLLVAEITCSIFNLIHLGNSIIIYELDYNDDGTMEGDVILALYISTCSCFILAIALNI